MDQNESSNAFRQLLDADVNFNPQSAGSEDQQMVPKNPSQAQRRGQFPYHFQPEPIQMNPQHSYQRQHEEQLRQRHEEQFRRQHQEQFWRQHEEQFQRQHEEELRRQHEEQFQRQHEEQLQRQHEEQFQRQLQQQLQHRHHHQYRYEQPTETVPNSYSQIARSEDQQMAHWITPGAQQHGHTRRHLQHHQTPYDAYPSRTAYSQTPSQQLQQQQHQYRSEPFHQHTQHFQQQQGQHQSQPLQTGVSQPQWLKRKRQPSNDNTESLQVEYDRPRLLSSRGLQSLPSHDYRPLHGSLVQRPFQHEQAHFGSSPRQTAYEYPYTLEQQSRYHSQPQRAGFGQLPIQTPGPPDMQSRSAPPAPPSPAGDFDSMSTAELREWSKAHNLPSSHNKAVLIEQAKTGMRVKVVNKGKGLKKYRNLEGSTVENAIKIESDPLPAQPTNVAPSPIVRNPQKDVPLSALSHNLIQQNHASNASSLSALPPLRDQQAILTQTPDMREYGFEIFEDPEHSRNQDDAHEPGMGDYEYELPLDEDKEEPAVNQPQARLEDEHTVGPNGSNDAGPSTSST
ncbi:MAG: hypothetical protein Q9175_007237 [Cornicularia normoerica]